MDYRYNLADSSIVGIRECQLLNLQYLVWMLQYEDDDDFSVLYVVCCLCKLLSVSFYCVLFKPALICINSDDSTWQEKRRGSSRVCTVGAPWILLTQAEFSNIGIVVVLKIPLTPDARLPLTPPMMTEAFHDLPPTNAWFNYSLKDEWLYLRKNEVFVENTSWRSLFFPVHQR